jgi:hypothetical protein
MNLAILAMACQRILSHPLRSGLLGLAIFLLTAFSAGVLLLTSAIESTADRIIESGPSIVISRIVAGGWAPIPVEDCAKVRAIAGVRETVPRVWGVLPSSPALTVLADPQLPDSSSDALQPTCLNSQVFTELRALDGTPVPIVLRSVCPANSLSQHTLWVSQPLARKLLLLPDQSATDLAVYSSRPEEDSALVPEIAAALPYPARIVTRAQMRGAYLGQTGQRSGLYLLLLGPALISLSLIIAMLASGGPMVRADVGKLKALGWTTAHVVLLHLGEFVFVAISSTLLGACTSYLALFAFGGGPLASSLLGWDSLSPGLRLDTSAAAPVLALVIASVLLPSTFAALLPAIRLARVDPAELLDNS